MSESIPVPLDVSECASSESISFPSDIELSDVSGLSGEESGDKQVPPYSENSEVSDFRGPSTSSAVVGKEKVRIRRRKRGGFKKGFLKQRKGHISPHSKSIDEPQSEIEQQDYLDNVKTNLDPELSEFEGQSVSCPSTLPSEGDFSQDGADEAEEKLHMSTQKKKRKKKRIGKIKKYYWKNKANPDTAPSSEAEGDSEDEDDNRALPLTTDASTVIDYRDLYLASSHSSENEFMSALKNYFILTLDERWTVKLAGDTLSICEITNPLKPIVERAIIWSRSSKVDLLVHNQQVPATSYLWDIKKADPKNCEEVADYLTNLTRRLGYFEICAGVQSHQFLWERFSDNTIVDHFSESPVLRSENCHILRVYPGRCSNCYKVLKRILDFERRRSRPSDESKINIRYLEKDDLVKKVKRIQNEKKLSQQQVRRLKGRINKLLEKHSEKIDLGLSDDFVRVLSENTDKMTSVEKLFWTQQSEALKKRGASKTMRWHPTMIRLALHLRMLSPAAYDFLKGFISLPSQRRLFDYSQFAEAKEGVQEIFLKQLSDLVEEKCPAEYQKYFNLLLDEMSIRSDLVYNIRTGDLVGYTNLTTLEEQLASLEAEIQGNIYEKKLAKKVLVFMLTGAVNDIKFVASVYSTDDLSAFQLFTRTWDVIYAVEEAGAKILTVICDGASVNRKFFNMHVKVGDSSCVHVTVNTATSENRPLYFMLDPPHLLKTFRNCFANSHSHRKSRALFINGFELSWKAIEALFEITNKLKYKDTKLTKAHVYLSSFSCMKVVLAAQVFSKSVATALQKHKDISPLKHYYNEELVNFILKMNRWFDCFNGSFDSKKKADNSDLLEYTSLSDPRFDFLENEFLPYLQQWEDSVSNRTGHFSKDQRSKMIISHQSLEGIKICILSFIEIIKFLLKKGAPYISARKFNQDPLEQYFADQRRVRGADNNPTVKQVLHSRVAFHSVGQMTSSGKRGNTEDLRQMEVDATPLPVRKKPRKP